MTFEFLRSVITNDTIHCEVKIEQLEEGGERTFITASVICQNQNEKKF
jgi:hypothetical protein